MMAAGFHPMALNLEKENGMRIEAIPRKDGGRPVAIRLGDEIITIQNLPDQQILRWSARDKTHLVFAIDCGMLSTEEALSRYPKLSPEQLDDWTFVIKKRYNVDQNDIPEKPAPKIAQQNPVLTATPDGYSVEACGFTLTFAGAMSREGKSIDLPPELSRVMRILMLRKGRSIPRRGIRRIIQETDKGQIISDNALIDLVSKLRKILFETFGFRVILSIKSQGYMVPIRLVD